MASRLMVARVRPGREDDWRHLVDELSSTRRAEWAQSNRRHGVRRVAVWICHGAEGMETAILCEGRGDDWPEGLAGSGKPFDAWLASRLGELTVSVTEAEALADTQMRFGVWREWGRR